MASSLPRGMLLATVLLSGCITNHYAIVMTPDGEKLHRELTVWQTSSGQEGEKLSAIDQAELDHIARAYRVDPPVAAKQKHRFDGTFEGRTPDDVGGAGTLTVWASKLGTASFYMERFRGSSDLNTSLAKRHAAADDLVDALLVWFEQELGDADEGDAVRDFFEDRLRDDLKNFATWTWMARAVSDAAMVDGDNHQAVAGLLQFLFERGYLRPDDLPMVARLSADADAVILLDFVRHRLAEQTGIDVEKLEFLNNTDRLQASINEHLHDFAPARTFLDEADDESKKPTDYLVSLIVQIVAPALFAGGDQLDVVLRCPVEPFRTNGGWSDEDSTVTWSKRLARRGKEPSGVLPVLLYAAWSVPDEAFQTERFGCVILKGEPLGRYCMWRNTLNEQQAAEWDTFVQSLRHDQDFVAAISEFRFSTDPEESEKGVADRARELILPHLDNGNASDED
ncbi:hypothetical protein Mal4_34020 [Maioricimonas rarisocia]|uniref:Uncharacterized protein n=1 Tax=Maioricimonas rarisocia TaxID=2528026 RepID=A0A517Z9A6_9PLAN|nr:hypothetical protein [Maioricimonas rarisocia]QDU39067.1 hypothetical protein Mal4_34020 [Maioricimonas rarisocia]